MVTLDKGPAKRYAIATNGIFLGVKRKKAGMERRRNAIFEVLRGWGVKNGAKAVGLRDFVSVGKIVGWDAIPAFKAQTLNARGIARHNSCK
jgi:hypothetical protein